MQIPQLPKEAREELPGATERASKYRGTFLWYLLIISIPSIISLVLFIKSLYSDTISDLKRALSEQKGETIKCREENIVLNERIISLLEHGTTKLEAVSNKTDTLSIKVDAAENNFSKTIKRIKNAVR